MDEAVLDSCAGFLVGGGVACPLVGRAGSWPLWWARAMSRGMSRGDCGFRKFLGSMSDDGWGCLQLICCLAWGILALEPTGYWVGPGLGDNDPSKMSAFRWVLLHMFTTSFYVPRQLHNPLPALETLQDKQVGLAEDPLLWLLLSWVLVHRRPCVYSPRVESLFPPVLWSSCDQVLLAFKAKCSGGSSSWCQTSRLGAQNSHSQWRTSVIYNYSPVCGSPTQGYGVW